MLWLNLPGIFCYFNYIPKYSFFKKKIYIMNLYNKDLLLLSDFSYWQSKKLYTQLMEKFINGIIAGQKFEEEFYQIWILNRNK